MKKNKLPGLVVVLIITLLTGVFWASLAIYRAFTIKPIESVPEAISEPITPTLDQSTIGKIESEILLDDSQIPQSVASTVPSPAPTRPVPTPLPTLTPGLTPTASPSAAPTVP